MTTLCLSNNRIQTKVSAVAVDADFAAKVIIEELYERFEGFWCVRLDFTFEFLSSSWNSLPCRHRSQFRDAEEVRDPSGRNEIRSAAVANGEPEYISYGDF